MRRCQPCLLFVVFLFVAAWWTSSQAASVAYTLEATDTTVSDPNEHQVRKLDVVSTARWFSLTEGSNRRIYDLTTNQVYYINLATRTYTQAALGGMVAARVRLHDSSAAMEDASTRVWFAQRCGIAVQGESSAFQIVTADEAQAWLLDGALLFSSSTVLTRATPEHLDNFMKILLYDYGLHPTFQAWVQSRAGLPQWVTIEHRIPEEQRWRIRLQNLRETPTATYSLKSLSFNEDGPPQTPVSRLLYQLSQKVPTLETLHPSGPASKSKPALAGTMRTLEEALRIYEQEELTPEPAPAGDSLYSHLRSDNFLQVFLQLRELAQTREVLDARSFTHTLNALDLLSERVGNKGHILDIIRGRLYVRSRQPGTYAQECFMRALQGNPRLARVYFDLGRTLMQENADPALAWLAFELGARHAPTLKESVQFREEAEALERKHPQFFKR